MQLTPSGAICSGEIMQKASITTTYSRQWSKLHTQVKLITSSIRYQGDDTLAEKTSNSAGACF